MAPVSRQTSRAWLLAAALLSLWACPARAQDPGAPIANLTSVFDDVKVLPQGKGGTWAVAEKGRALYRLDVVRTGPRGRARIEFVDRVQEDNAGPSVVNVGSSTEISMEKFDFSLTEKASQGILGLIRGTIRTFFKNFGGSRSSFAVRTGTSLCGIRGSESTVTYEGDEGSGGQGKAFQSCLSGNCFTIGDSTPPGGRPLQTGYQRYLPSNDPSQWRDFRLSQQKIQDLLQRTGVPGVSEGSEEGLHRQRYGGGGGGGVTPGEYFGVKWTAEGLPDCRAEVLDLMLNSYKWDDIKDYRGFTFYRDELIGGRFVVSGLIKTDCPAEILDIEVSADGGTSWVRARFSKETMTFRYAFNPTGFSELDLRVRPTFKSEIVDEVQVRMGLKRRE